MIHVVTSANRSLYVRHLEEMHRQRWRFYVEERGWRTLGAMQEIPGYERDEYDDERAVYLLAIAADGTLRGSTRVRPTDDKCMMADHFPHLVEPPFVLDRGADVWELSRVVRCKEERGVAGSLRMEANCGLIEAALMKGIRKMVTVADTFLLPGSRSLYRNKQNLIGLPHAYEEGEVIAIEYIVDAETLQIVREKACATRPVVFEMAPPVASADELCTPEMAAFLVDHLRGLSREKTQRIIKWLSMEQVAHKQEAWAHA